MNEEKLRDILLEHVGAKNAIASKHISTLMGFPMEDTQSVSRNAIWTVAEKYHLPLVSSAKGYYIAESAEEVMQYNDNMQKRIDGINRTREMATKNFFDKKEE